MCTKLPLLTAHTSLLPVSKSKFTIQSLKNTRNKHLSLCDHAEIKYLILFDLYGKKPTYLTKALLSQTVLGSLSQTHHSGNLHSSKPSSITKDILFAFSMPSKLVANRTLKVFFLHLRGALPCPSQRLQMDLVFSTHILKREGGFQSPLL